MKQIIQKNRIVHEYIRGPINKNDYLNLFDDLINLIQNHDNTRYNNPDEIKLYNLALKMKTKFKKKLIWFL